MILVAFITWIVVLTLIAAACGKPIFRAFDWAYTVHPMAVLPMAVVCIGVCGGASGMLVITIFQLLGVIS